MSAFPELNSARAEQDDDRLGLPIRGVTYWFSKSIPMQLGMALALARTQAQEMAKEGKLDETPPALLGFTEEEMQRGLIGDQWDVMLNGGVKTDEWQTVYDTLFTYHLAGEKAAMLVWTGEVGREGDAHPPAPSASKAPTTSRTSSTRKRSAATKPKPTRRRSSAGGTSSKAGT